MNMGEKILMLRKARGWSQEELADRIGVTRQAVSRWESGNAKPDADKLIAISDQFGVTADYLLREQYTETVSSERGYVKQRGRVSLTGNQVMGLSLFALGLLILIGLEILCVIHPHTLYTDTKVYQGLAAYVRVYHLQWITWILYLLIATGLILILVEPIKKLFQIVRRK